MEAGGVDRIAERLTETDHARVGYPRSRSG